MHITVIGTGYVGLVTGACFSKMGNKVYCVDIVEEKINGLKKGILPIYEPNLDNLVISSQEKGDLIFTTDIKEALDDSNIVFIAVGIDVIEFAFLECRLCKRTSETHYCHNGKMASFDVFDRHSVLYFVVINCKSIIICEYTKKGWPLKLLCRIF